MKNFIYILSGLILLTWGCKKAITSDDLISPLTVSALTVDADGKSKITISTVMNSNTDADKRSVMFSASSGSFAGGTDTMITQKAFFINKQLVATVTYIAPSSPGDVTITARATLPDAYHDYSQSAVIRANTSVPVKIIISASGFGVKVNYGSELTITGKLTNKNDNPASKGSTVKFEDRYTDHTPVGGSFRQVQSSSDASGGVSAIYSPGNVPVGKQIWLIGTLLDAAGKKTDIRDSVSINSIAN